MSGGRPDPFAPAPSGGGWFCASSLSEGSRTMRYALPSAITRESSPTVMVSAPRVHFTSNCFALSIVTCPTVGSSDLGLITAVDAFSANAFTFAVENVAVPRSSLASGIPPSSSTVAMEEAASIKRAALVRNCTLPASAVLSLSPEKIVVPTAAPAPPTLARSDATTVPRAPAEAPQTGVISKQDVKIAATISRERVIEVSKRAIGRILTAFVAVNTESFPCEKSLLPPTHCLLWLWRVSAATMHANTWLTGNRSPPGFVGPAPARTPSGS